MKTTIDKDDSPQSLQEKLQALRKAGKKGNLSKHFGKLKRGIDGLEYQKKARNEWD